MSLSTFFLIHIYVYRHFMGEDLDNLSFKELQSVEHQIDSALKHIRTKKVTKSKARLR